MNTLVANARDVELDAIAAAAVNPQLQKVPELLKSLPNWLTWKLINVGGHDTKVPFVAGTDRHASSTDSATLVASITLAARPLETKLSQRTGPQTQR